MSFVSFDIQCHLVANIMVHDLSHVISGALLVFGKRRFYQYSVIIFSFLFWQDMVEVLVYHNPTNPAFVHLTAVHTRATYNTYFRL